MLGGQRWTRVWRAVLIGLFFIAIPVWAQRAGGTPAQANSNTQGTMQSDLEIHVLLPSGAPAEAEYRVVVMLPSGVPVVQGFSNNRSGVADFRNLNPGNYRVEISGVGIAKLTSPIFEVRTGESVHREMYTITPSSGSSAVPSGAPTPAQELRVPDKAREEFDKGMAAYGKGDAATAKAELAKAVEIYPNYVQAHNNLGVLYLAANDSAHAQQEFDAALKSDPKFIAGYVNLAKLAIHDQKLPEAEAQLDKALAIDPKALTALVLLTSTQYASNEYDKALATAQQVHAQPGHEQFADIHLVAGEIHLKAGHAKEAVGEFEMFLKEKPQDPRAPKVRDLVAKLQAPQPQSAQAPSPK